MKISSVIFIHYALNEKKKTTTTMNKITTKKFLF